MRLLYSLATHSLLTATAVLSSPAPIDRRQSGTITWRDCLVDGVKSTDALPFDCATHPVPLDYTNTTSTSTLKLNLVRIRATESPFLGTIFFNPGGPGYSGRQNLYTGRELWQTVIGKHHDIVAWDYRGTGTTLPFSCFATEAERINFYTESSSGAVSWRASDTALGDTWASQGWLAEACGGDGNATAVGELVGTAFTARDLMELVDAIGEDGMVRFWGISYGTALGGTVAKMFPDRIERMVLDAVLDPNEYFEGRDVSQVTASDATFEAFLSECMKARTLCSLAAHASSAEELAEKLWTKFEEARLEPIVFGALGMQKGARIRSTIFQSLYGPVGDAAVQLATYLEAISTGNATTYGEYLLASTASGGSEMPFPDCSSLRDKENYPGIRCSDQSLRVDSREELLPLLKEFANESRLDGDLVPYTQTINCAQWPFKAKERPEGRFEDIETKNPILFVNPRYDPITSLSAAHSASKAFLGSRVLEHNGFGHSSNSHLSACTVKAIRAYFKTGVLPDEGTVCQTDNPVFTTADGLDVLRRKLAEEGL